jgi:kumamolisin
MAPAPFRRRVPLDELKRKYSPAAADTKDLVSWLEDQGFKVTQIAADNTGVYAEASVGKIEKSLAVNMVRVTKGGLTYTAAQDAPSMPADIAKNVQAIIGLQPFRKAQKHFRICSPKAGNRTSLVTNDPANGLAGEKSSAARRSPSVSATAGAPSLNVENAPPYLVSEIMKAYDADGLTVTGKGQTIAILIDTAPAESDLQLFWSRNSSPATLNQIEMINLKGSPLWDRRVFAISRWEAMVNSAQVLATTWLPVSACPTSRNLYGR